MPEKPGTFQPLTNSQPTLADLLTIETSASIFYSYARELELSVRFNSDDMSTLLVPTNKAVMALARKPHQDPDPVEPKIEISEQESDQLSKRNVERWVSAHIIPKSPISFSSEAKAYETLLEGKSVTFKAMSDESGEPEWTQVDLEDGTRIIGMRKAKNGVMYIIDSTVKF
ncbi:hypothetical protein SERLA73DRAFT_129358 [Serpula lacrymans var. lacrymans S7.3]|uniref:FAS1 domain-containing protein n=2 Tax=Serpula lacrymans var. lacrymans TaxID=341189 RepID=F8PGI4_SERL3|nr:uncharacterized protein SERLADRAFT_377164 [Serpula lacrymans var. lacrymans S7.9]EGO05417.1 hypothetical protein SERLA73DRAFT_129358 [Serpula lacrymans var. lacrymans S7.3]EGO31264.1 hypothetical protein SERLADRAFT_377164 [Serpula lacrymans var. lacrymans S7.9]